MENAKAEPGLQDVDTEVMTGYPDDGLSTVLKSTNEEECIRNYDQWAKSGKYDTDGQADSYNGPRYAAETLHKYFQGTKSGTKILDVAAGTGLVGLELQRLGYSNIDALDPSAGMLAHAAAKGVYRKLICDGIGAGETEINEDTYDAVVVAGGLADGHHIACIAMKELIRIVKPGGLIINAMRDEFLSYVKEYVDRLEPFFNELEDGSIWKKLERTVLPSFCFGKNGVVFVYQVLVHSCPPFESKIV